MDIRSLNPSLLQADAQRQSAVGEQGHVNGRTPPIRERTSLPPEARDSIEFSPASRAHSSAAPPVKDMEFARRALLGVPPLSEKRASDIMSRIQEGYYNKPEIVQQIADRIASEITGGSDLPGLL